MNSVQAQITIVPKPNRVEMREGFFAMRPGTTIGVDPDTLALGRQLSSYLSGATGFILPVQNTGTEDANTIRLRLVSGPQGIPAEGYRLKVTPSSVRMEASDRAGLFYAIQTLRQLLPVSIFSEDPVPGVVWRIPCVVIEDHPRFSWRGLHLDVCRHFMPKAFVKKYIDLLALHKMNRFHWHLTEDQGWRIEIKKYPKLTQVGAWRKETLIGHAGQGPSQFDGRRHGGFYTQQEVREIVAYAKERFVTVVPEIEMPGHSQAAIAAYPELGVTGQALEVMTTWGVSEHILNVEESTIQFYQDVLTEVMALFDSPFIHIGGDEAPKKQWRQSARIQARMKELGIDDEHALQSWFIQRMDTFLTHKGRRLVGWDEILEGGLAPGAVVMSWRGEDGGIAAAQAGHDVIMAPTSHTYLDYYQADAKQEPLAIGGFLPLNKVYSYNPIPDILSPDEARHVLGVQGQVWTEYIPTPEHAEYMAYPRACALAEVAWTDPAHKDYPEFRQRLAPHVERLKRLHVNFRPLDTP